jgi:hypothetical protein
MLDMQTAVRDKTVALDKLIRRAADKKARPKDRQVSVKLAQDEKRLVALATKALGVLESGGTAAALREICQQLREDMNRVQCRLESGDVGTDTQAIEDDILDSLKEMVASLNRT